MDWKDYWEQLLSNNKLSDKVDEMNAFDGSPIIEGICHDIYNDYNSIKQELDEIRNKFVAVVENLKGVHLHTSRVKDVDSLLKKVIEKRYERLLNKRDLYANINGCNYKEIITDLVGIRLILSYRGDWKELHNDIVSKFPYYDDIDAYSEYSFIPHEDNRCFIAEIPKAYYATGDDLGIYENENVRCILHKNGYRSVHYIISYCKVYIELQTRTIYDEAWSDCNHEYVYKHDENISHVALKKLSDVLSEFTNTSNDFGDEMRIVFHESPIKDCGNNVFMTSEQVINEIKELSNRYNKAKDLLDAFIEQLREGEI